MDQIANLIAFYEKDELEKALNIANELISGQEQLFLAYLWSGKIHYRMQRWGDAINNYQLALEIDPENEEAKAGVNLATSILDYFTPDMFNP